MEVTYNIIKGSASKQLVESSVTAQLESHQVYIETTHSGLCGTDEHYLGADMALGHEGAGIVRQVGQGVKTVKVGDRVGFGYTHEVCAHCDNCAQGWDQFCRDQKRYGSHDFLNGTFSSGAVWDEKCVYPIPDGYDSANAAPLMCAGATVWTVLSRYGVVARDRVAVMGIGGLGHLAIKLAAAMGCHVVVLSSSESKRQEAMDYGASEFHVFRSGEKPVDTISPIKHLLMCGSGGVDYKSIIPLMDTHGAIYPLTVAFEPSPIPLLELVLSGIKIQGSLVASRDTMRSLLEFAARKNITPTIMTYPMNVKGVETAMQDLRDGKVRYRAVLCRE
ncbi:alcohol dehydrogenase [Karstenula rhodostoma CBS 690.94]|uniref:Alcohol dehydrogenase n=1 Tax=Karstenula rhodostoma CBS 690.94 TaxID=1392251 RepID=A0A9P4PR19_9PLEO|nr:alcohol dehydrogenase [Karstenula rhodostoma CBS 690.94]